MFVSMSTVLGKDRRAGVTLIELLIVVVILGLIVVIGVPRISRGLVQQDVRSARDAIAGMHATARAAAIQRSRPTRLVFGSNTMLIRSQDPVTGTLDTIGAVVDLESRFGVSLASTRDSLVFDARGLGTEGGSTVITVSRAGRADTVQVNMWGRIRK